MKPSTDQSKKKRRHREVPASANDNKAIETLRRELEAVRATLPGAGQTRDGAAKAEGTVIKIVNAAHEIFIEDGHSGLSLRKVADRAGIAVGNLNYHFPTKRELLETTLRCALANHLAAHLRVVEASDPEPLEALLTVVDYYVRDGRTSYRFFYQLWGFAGSSDAARDLVRSLYRPIGRFIYYLVREANPALTDAQIRLAVLQIFSLEEGYKLFIGMGPDDTNELATAERDVRALTQRLVHMA